MFKSLINHRIVRSVGKIAYTLAVAFFALQIGKVGMTNSFFADRVDVGTNSFGAGVWIPELEMTFAPTQPEADGWYHLTPCVYLDSSIDDVTIYYSLEEDGGELIESDEYQEGECISVPAGVWDFEAWAENNENSAWQSESVETEFKVAQAVVLNEILPDPAGSDNSDEDHSEYVELYNNSGTAVDLAGWRVYAGDDFIEIDNDTTDGDGTVINPHDFLTVWFYKKWNDSVLNNGSEKVALYDGIRSSSELYDEYEYSYSGDKVDDTFARNPDGIGNWEDPVPTPNKPNDFEEKHKNNLDHYEKICFEDDEPVCEKDFMKKLGIWPSFAEASEDKEDEEEEDEEKKEEDEQKQKDEADVSTDISTNVSTDEDTGADTDTETDETDGQLTQPKEDGKPAEETSGDDQNDGDEPESDDAEQPAKEEESDQPEIKDEDADGEPDDDSEPEEPDGLEG